MRKGNEKAVLLMNKLLIDSREGGVYEANN